MPTQSEPSLLTPKEIGQAIWGSFRDTWIPSVGIPLLLAVAAIPVDWWLRGHDEAAWDQVTGDDFRSGLIVLLAATVLVLVWHIFTAPIKHARAELRNERENTSRVKAQLWQQQELVDQQKPRKDAIEELRRLISSGEGVQNRIRISTDPTGLRSDLDEWLRDTSASLDSAAQVLPGRAESFRIIRPVGVATFGTGEDERSKLLLRELNPKLEFLRNELTALKSK